MKRKSAYSPSAREKLAFKIPVRRSGQRHYSTSLKRCTPSKCASKRTFATLLPFAIARKMPVPSCQVAPGPGGKAHALSPRHGAHRGGGPPPGLRPPPGGGGPLLLALAEEARKGGGVVRLHSGDPGLYGTLLEEKEALEALGVGVEVVPGVTAAFALAARAGLSLTAPGVAQAVAFTRLGVRPPVPEGQDPKSLARKGLTLAVYLSGMHPRRLSRELLEAGLPGDTPVLYGHKVAQPGEEVGLTDLKGLAHLPARDTTVYLVGEALRAKGVRSLLYDPSFKHRYRR